MAECSRGLEEQCSVCSFSYSLVYPVLQCLHIRILSDHACPCMYRFVFVHSWSTFSFILHQGQYFFPSTINPTVLCCCHSRTVGIYWWMASVMAQHAVIYVMRLFKAQGSPVLVIQHQLYLFVIVFPDLLGDFTHSHQLLLLV